MASVCDGIYITRSARSAISGAVRCKATAVPRRRRLGAYALRRPDAASAPLPRIGAPTAPPGPRGLPRALFSSESRTALSLESRASA